MLGRNLGERIKNLEKEIASLKEKTESKGNLSSILKEIAIPNIGNIIICFFIFITTSNLVKISEITNPIFKKLYTADYIYGNLIQPNTEDSENVQKLIDISEIASTDEDSHKDILNITKKWDDTDYLDFVKTGENQHNAGYGYLFSALRKEYDRHLNELVSNPQASIENYRRFNREFSGHAINVTLERLGLEGLPDKCGGPEIKQDDLKIIFVYSKHLKNTEKVLACPGSNRPNFIFVRLIGKYNITEAKIELVGINEQALPDKPIVRLTDAVAKQLGWQEEQNIEEGTLEIMYSTN